MKKRLLVLSLLAGLLIFSSCGKKAEVTTETSEDATKVLVEEKVSADVKKFTFATKEGESLEFTTPSKWVFIEQFKSINPALSFLIGHDSAYISAIIEPSSIFESFDDYKSQAIEILNSQFNSDIQTEDITINNLKGIVTLPFETVIGGDELTYVIYLIESENSFFQILTWTKIKDFDANKDEVSDIVKSFTIVK